MKKLLAIVYILFLIPFSSFVCADGPGWTVTSVVKDLVVVANGGVNVRIEPDLNGCTSQSGYGQHFASIYPDHPGLNAFHSYLLAAKISGKKVQLYLYDNTCKVVEMIIKD